MSEKTVLTSDQPWPGANAYTGADRNYFHGRKRETDELLRLVRRDVITLVIGADGVGKTSLIQAGLLPSLDDGEWLPVMPSLDWTAESPTSAAPDINPAAPAPALDSPLSRALIESLVAAASERRLASPQFSPGETLWEFFHRKNNRWWSSRQRVVTPLVIIDGFESIFTTARVNATAERQAATFLKELSQLAANRPPQRLAMRLENGTASESAYDFDPVPLRIVLVMREEFTPRLAGLRPLFPTLRRSELRIEPFNTSQARDVLMRAAMQGSLMSDAALDAVVARLASEAGDGKGISPAKLSTLAHALAEARMERGAAQITPDFLPSANSISPPVRLPMAEASLSPAAETEDLKQELAQSERRRRSSQRLSAVAITAAVLAIAVPVVRNQIGVRGPSGGETVANREVVSTTPIPTTPPPVETVSTVDSPFSLDSREYLPVVPEKPMPASIAEPAPDRPPEPVTQQALPPPPVGQDALAPVPSPAQSDPAPSPPAVPVATPRPATPNDGPSALSPEAQRQVDAATAERREQQLRREFLQRQQPERRTRETAPRESTPSRKSGTPAPESAQRPPRKRPAAAADGG